MAEHAKEKQIPLVLLVSGLVLYVLGAVFVGGSRDIAPTMVALTIAVIVQTALLIGAAFIVAALVNVSFGEPATAILKFAGASVFAGSIAALIPMGGLIGLVLFLGLVAWLFELELVYAIVLAVIYTALSWVVAIVLASVL